MENTDKRMADNYEIISAFRIGDKEVVFGRDMTSTEPYFCALYEKENIICYTRERYNDCVVSEDYVEIMDIFAERIKQQCQKVREEWAKITVPRIPITPEMCYINDYDKSIEGKIVAIKKSVFRPEYQSADHQLVYVVGGNGAKAQSRGNACFCVNLYSGKEVRWERYEVQGEVKPEYLPDWARDRLKIVLRERDKKAKERDAR